MGTLDYISHENLRNTKRRAAGFYKSAYLDACKTKSKAKKQLIYLRTNTNISNYFRERYDQVRSMAKTRSDGYIYAPPEKKLAFILRIKGIHRLNPKVSKILQLLRLNKLHNGVFVKLNMPCIRMLSLVEPYVT